MAKGSRARNAVSAVALAVTFAGFSSPADAQYLFDRLFGQRVPRQQQMTPPAAVPQPQSVQPQRRPQQQAPAAQAKPQPVKKVSAPSFYGYKAENLVPLSLAALKSSLAASADSADAAGQDSSFREALAATTDLDLFVEKPVAEAIQAFYTSNPRFIWLDENGTTERARSVMAVLNDAEAHGLTGSDYSVSNRFFPAATSEEARLSRLKAMLQFELTLTARALRYARDAHMGRVDPNRLSGFHDFERKSLDKKQVLDVLASSDAPDRYLESLHPQNDAYAALKAELAKLRAEAVAEEEIVLDQGLLLKPGGRHPDLPKILRIIDRKADSSFREQHGAVLAAAAGTDTYLAELVPVIKAVQRQHDLNPDGIIGRRTVSVLAGETRSAKIQKVLLAMERLRWHPSRWGNTRVVLNVPSFTASYIENGVEKLNMRTVVGTTTNQTYFFHDEIEYVEFNPYWGVPQSILVNEKLPRLRQDPGYLDRAGYEVFDRSGRQVSSASIDWNRYGSSVPFTVRQKPGPSNSLGELKIMFPNKHDIYMHDTPQKHLFSRDVRAFSHGCVRLEDPRAMAAAVLGISREQVGKYIAGGRNSRKNVQVKIPVYVSYFTAWPDLAGKVSYYDDIYGRDAHLAKALALVDGARSAGS